MRSAGWIFAALFSAILNCAVAGDLPKYDKMNYGPYLSASIVCDPNFNIDGPSGHFTVGESKAPCDTVARGFAIRLTDDWKAGVVFDADTMRMAAGWSGGPLKFNGLIGNGDHGPGPTLSVPPTFQVPNGPGWADANGSFKDPREDSIPPLPRPGLLPADWSRYNGLYLHDNQVVLSYTVGSSAVLEAPTLETSGDLKAFARTITVGFSAGAQVLFVAGVNERAAVKTPAVKDEKGKVTQKEKVTVTFTPSTGKVDGGIAHVGAIHAAVVGAPNGAELEVVGNAIHFRLPAHAEAVTFKVLIAGGGDATKAEFEALAKSSAKPTDLTPLTKGGPARWTETVETKGVLAAQKDGDTAAYVLDKLTIPYANPYNSWMRTAGFDFFKDGTRAAVSTWSGDVWIVSGIDATLEHLHWKRVATGLHQPLGLKIVNDEIYTVGHDQITKLVDLNGDGEADFYQCFNNNWELTSAFHAFAFDLHTDPEGNFYFAFGSPVRPGGGGFQKITKSHGTIFKVSPDGMKIEPYATGVRAPNGMCVSPTGQVTIGDNEGSWVPTSPLHWVKKGSFLGVGDSAHGAKVEQPKPLLWLPHNNDKTHATIDNSCGGQAWVTSDKWGPFKNYLLHMSYGTSSLFVTMPQEVNGQMQGAAVKIPVAFTSSAMRARFNPLDGQLYIVGLKGWQSNAAQDGGFDRVRYTGKPVHMPSGFKATKNGVYLTYTAALDQAYASDAQNFIVDGWDYKWTSNYGSPEIKLEKDAAGRETKGHDAFAVKSAKLQPDGKTIFLEMPDIKPCMQIHIKASVKAADGVDMKQDIFGTIYNLPAE